MLHVPVHTYEKLRASFRWTIPQHANIGLDVVDRWARIAPDRPAVIDASVTPPRITRFEDLRQQSNRLAHALARQGIGRGDRVAVFLPQMAEVVVAHVAIAKRSAIVLPLAAVFGTDALAHRCGDAGVVAAITDARGAAKFAELTPRSAAPSMVISVDGPDGSVLGFGELLARESAEFIGPSTLAEDPALMIYTSGTTGQPKGALHAHRVVAGHVPGVCFSHPSLGSAGGLMWTPADWAWAGGLLNAVLPALHCGVAVLARRAQRFDPEAALGLLRDFPVSCAFVPPTALRMLRAFAPEGLGATDGLALQSLSSAGEVLGAETQDWARRAFGVPVNDVYGQTECNYVLGSSAAYGVDSPGAIGRPVPGHDVAVIRPDGSLCAVDEPGGIAVARPDPTMFLGYWNQPAATAAKFVGDFMQTGDQATVDAEGYVHFLGRDDDIITSSGFRIGPGEIEDCLLRHPLVAAAAAVGKPDPIRTEIVKAFVVLREGVAASDALAGEIRAFVRTRLSAHEYPREIAFVPALPMTATGKIMRRLLRQAG